MASSIARPLLCRATRHQLSFAFCARRHHPLYYPFLASSVRFSSLVQNALTQCHNKSLPFLPLRFASSKVGADESLLQVLQSEINCIQEFKDPRDLDAPEGFSFEIVDNPGDQTITLKREFGGEKIQAIVYMNLYEEDNGEEDDKDDDDSDEESAVKPTISLHVSIDKDDGPILEFDCNLNSDKLEIENMAKKSGNVSDDQGAYEGPDFSDLDESLQKALHKYLEGRGINGSLYGFLYEYMMNKDEREYQTWLKNIEEFVRK